MAQAPLLKAMLVCDNTIVEEHTHKRTLMGLFDNIRAVKFPCTHFMLHVFVQFTDVEGVHAFQLELRDLQKDQEIAKAEIPNFKVVSRLGSYDLVFKLMNLKFPHPGDYEFRIFCDGVIFGQKTFRVVGQDPD